MDAGRAVAREVDGLFHDRRDTLPIDVLHGEDVHLRIAHRDFFALVEVADADDGGVSRQHLRRERADLRELDRFGAEQRGERHAVDVPRKRRGRRVHVAVGVDPQQSQRQLFRFLRPFRRRRRRSSRQAVVAAENDRHRPFVERRQRRLIQLLAHPGDVADVLLALVAELLRFGNRRRQIAFVDERAAEGGDAFAESGDPERGRSHVDAAAVAAEIQRHADDVDGFHRSFTDTDMPSPDGETMVETSSGLFKMASRKSPISARLLTTLCATSTPRGGMRGSTRSRKRL